MNRLSIYVYQTENGYLVTEQDIQDERMRFRIRKSWVAETIPSLLTLLESLAKKANEPEKK